MSPMPRAKHCLVTVALGLAVGCSSPAEREPSPPGAALTIDIARAEKVLFGTEPVPAQCAEQVDAERVRCLIAARYAADPRARDLALAEFTERGGLVGVGPAQEIDGGYRGRIRLVPELPVGAHRKHLEWVTQSTRDFDAFFAAIERAATAPIRYRW